MTDTKKKLWNNVGPEGGSIRLVFTSDDLVGEVVEKFLAEGYESNDGDPISVGGIHIGFLLVKFSPWNIAYDFVVISSIPDLDILEAGEEEDYYGSMQHLNAEMAGIQPDDEDDDLLMGACRSCHGNGCDMCMGTGRQEV